AKRIAPTTDHITGVTVCGSVLGAMRSLRSLIAPYAFYDFAFSPSSASEAASSGMCSGSSRRPKDLVRVDL
ncbi:MAG TPA: hypothetical protein VFY92_10245, partial [Hyphomicrobiaceae bacterium]|nr:hypothetical protein [Hyphomicrobiaceae bacterium]